MRMCALIIINSTGRQTGNIHLAPPKGFEMIFLKGQFTQITKKNMFSYLEGYLAMKAFGLKLLRV